MPIIRKDKVCRKVWTLLGGALVKRFNTSEVLLRGMPHSPRNLSKVKVELKNTSNLPPPR